MPPTVLVVDDHAGFRASARALLEAQGFEVVGDVPDGAGALDAARILNPDLVLLDILLPGVDGIEVAGMLAALPNPPKVVLTSSHDSRTYGRRLLEAPVRGFIAKSGLSGAGLRKLLDG